jgi:hypothetical protein
METPGPVAEYAESGIGRQRLGKRKRGVLMKSG